MYVIYIIGTLRKDGLFMNKKKIWLIVGIAAAVLVLAGIAVWFFFFRAPAVPSDPNEIAYVSPVSDITGSGGLGMVTKYSGVVEPQKTLYVQKDESKKVDKLYVTVGQEVKVGDKLFSYDTEDLALQLEEAELQLESLGNRISTLKQQIESLEKERNNASSDDRLSYTLQIQSIQLEIKTTEYDQSAKAKEIEQLKQSLENADVLAEMAGVVKEIKENNNQNDYYGSDNSSNGFITILATGQYRVKATATELNIQTLYEGMAVKVTSRIDQEATWSGVIDTIEREPVSNNQNSYISYGNESSFTPASKYNFYILLDSFDGLMLGQHVYAEPDFGGMVKTGLWLPSYYVFTEGSTSYVWAANAQNRLEKREVSLGQFDIDLSEYEILSGITTEDRIAVPSENLHSGMYALEGSGYEMGGFGTDGDMTDGDFYPADDLPADGDFSAADMPSVDADASVTGGAVG